MSLTRAIAAISTSVIASIVLSFGISAMAEDPPAAPQVASVVWEERPESVSELGGDSTVLVEAEVTAIEAGPDLPAEPGDDLAMPTQRIVFSTTEVLDGQIAETFKLFKTGSEELYLQGDPLYEAGESYLLFLEPQGEPGTYIPAAPDGRIELDAQGEADPVIPGPVAEQVEGESTEQIAEAAE
jgi:hypothetical protein